MPVARGVGDRHSRRDRAPRAREPTFLTGNGARRTLLGQNQGERCGSRLLVPFFFCAISSATERTPSMGRVHVRAHGAFPPERFVAALTDFGPGRSEIWGNSDEGRLTVHERGDPGPR